MVMDAGIKVNVFFLSVVLVDSDISVLWVSLVYIDDGRSSSLRL